MPVRLSGEAPAERVGARASGRHPLGLAFEAGDHDAIIPLLAPDVVLHSPVTGIRPFEGREAVSHLLRVLIDEYEGWQCLHESGGDDTHVLVTRARIGGRQVDIVDVLRHDKEGRICEIRVTGRPLSGVATFASIVGPRLARRRGRIRAALLRAGAAPLPALLALLDRVGTPLALPHRRRP